METEQITSYIGIGSNLGDRAGNILYALRGLIEASFLVTKVSAVYETEPVDMDSELRFLNVVAEIRSEGVTPSQLLARLLRIEYLLGRTDKSLKKPRTIDLDLLIFGNQSVDTPFLTVPHPRLHLRKFVLVPLLEIAPGLVHPVLHRDIRSIAAECPDDSEVIRWNALSAAPTGALARG